MQLNDYWERFIRDSGADFARFVDARALPGEAAEGYTCAVLFGKALSREYIHALRADQEPEGKEHHSVESKMGTLAGKLVDGLEAQGFRSTAKVKPSLLPHKTVALRAGVGFIGKNNLLVTERYGCALMISKVLTTAPFETEAHEPMEPRCGDCSACVDVCPTKALRGATWSLATSRDEMIARKLCARCLKCMLWCPYTGRYAEGAVAPI